MKRINLILAVLVFTTSVFAQVHTSYLWHMQQPNYWPEKSKVNPERYQTVWESFSLKSHGDSWNVYSDGKSHPLNDLEEIFGKYDRVKAYQHGPKNSVQTLLHLPNAGAQVNYSGCLIENVNSLADAGVWNYYKGWNDNFKEAKNWKTSGGLPRMDMIGFTFHHALSPLISERALTKEIQAHKYISVNTFDGPYSKGFWPAECSFSERIIKVLVEEGFEWSVIANSHLSRTLNDYPNNEYGTSGVNVDPPNKADKVQTEGRNWWKGQIDGRGGTFAAPYCYQAHKAQYVDPETGAKYKMDVVPMCDLLSYQNGFSSMGTSEIDKNIAPFSNSSHPSIVLLAHDGDNAWGGGDSYYQESVPGFANAAAAKGYDPTTIQQFLTSNPVPDNDLVKVEDGSWVNAANDWGHPQFINWLWPLYEKEKYRFDPNGWTEDARNWAVITAAENYVLMAEDLAGNVDIADVVNPGSSASNAEKAWHFFLPSLTSGYMYYGKAIDMEVKQTLAGNNAIEFAQSEINNHAGKDNTAPSVFIPQRFPYNPGGKGFGPIYGYREYQNSSDFHIWTFAYDVSGLSSVELKYRTDADGENPLSNDENEIYVGGSGVSSWISKPMTRKAYPKTNVANDPEIDFFILPTKIAALCYAEITELSNVLVDYYVEVTDTKGNVFKTPIQHVYVGEYKNDVDVNLTVNPAAGNYPDIVKVNMSATTTAKNASVKIYYSDNESLPNTSSKLYSQEFSVGSSTSKPITIKSIAVDSEGNKSDIESRTYTFGELSEFSVHFKNTESWNNVYVYLFDEATKKELPGWKWPGKLMSREGNSDWYEYTVKEAGVVGIVFNNNVERKTVDLTRVSDGWYDFGTKKWSGKCPGDCPGELPLPTLSASPLGGKYTNPVQVTLSSTNNGKIYYTTNGENPDQNSTPYLNSITITESLTLKGVAYNTTGKSNVVTEIYEIETPKVYDIHFLNSDNWDNVYIYLFNSKTGAKIDGWNWPGKLMTKELTSSWFKYSISELGEVGIVFNNNSGQQSGDLIRSLEGWFDFGSKTWSSSCPHSCPGEPSEGITIYFNNSTANWASIKMYFWNTTPAKLTTQWPGELMTDEDGDGWYSYKLPDVECTKLIFSNNGVSQTKDLEICSDSYYDGGWVTAPSQGVKANGGFRGEPSEDIIRIYPNPASSEEITISTSGKKDSRFSLKLYNVSGTLVKNKIIFGDDNQLDIKELQAGVYYLITENQETKISFRNKLMIY